MLDDLKKWWNRKWFDWHEHQEITKTTFDGRVIGKYLVLKRVSNDGIVQLKKIKIFEL